MPPSLAYFVEIFYFPLPMYITVEGGGRGVRGDSPWKMLKSRLKSVQSGAISVVFVPFFLTKMPLKLAHFVVKDLF